jgi:uncharacterized protein YegL
MSNLQPTENKSLANTGDFSRQLKEALNVQIKARPYTAYITRRTPSAFVFLIDQSGSMASKIKDSNGQITTKSEWLASAINNILNDIVDRCIKGTEIREYFEIAIIGYGGESPEKANFAWQGKLKGKTWVKIHELMESFLYQKVDQIEENIRGKIKTKPQIRKYWIEPIAKTLTPMNAAFELAADLLEKWIVRHQNMDIYPPTVINVTDGELTDAPFNTVLKTASRIKNLHTMDGNVLLLNLHIASSDDDPVYFPSTKDSLPENEFAYLLFDMSSDLPEVYQNDIAKFKMQDRQGSFTGMAFNGTMDKIIQIMNIGTKTTSGRIQQNV